MFFLKQDYLSMSRRAIIELVPSDKWALGKRALLQLIEKIDADVFMICSTLEQARDIREVLPDLDAAFLFCHRNKFTHVWHNLELKTDAQVISLYAKPELKAEFGVFSEHACANLCVSVPGGTFFPFSSFKFDLSKRLIMSAQVRRIAPEVFKASSNNPPKEENVTFVIAHFDGEGNLSEDISLDSLTSQPVVVTQVVTQVKKHD